MQESGEMPSAPLPSVSASVLCERVSSVAAFPEDAKKKLAEDDRSFALLSYLTTKFTTLKLDLTSHCTELADDDDADDEDAGQVHAASSSVDSRKLDCPVCGQEVKSSDAVPCPKSDCRSKALKHGCLIACKKCEESLCSQDCVDDHGFSG